MIVVVVILVARGHSTASVARGHSTASVEAQGCAAATKARLREREAAVEPADAKPRAVDESVSRPDGL